MNRPVVHFALSLTCFIGLSVGGSSTSEAGIWPFCHSGWGSPVTTAYYPPVYGYSRPVTTFYSPVWSPRRTYYPPVWSPRRTYYPPVWRPWQTYYPPACAPCGVACAPCGTGVCASGVTTLPAESAPRTFVDEENGSGGGDPSDPWQQRQKVPPTTIPEAKPAPIPESLNDTRKSGPSFRVNDSTAFRIRSLNLDDKITWRPVTQRERLQIRSRLDARIRLKLAACI